MTGQVLIPEHNNRFIITLEGVKMSSANSSFNLEVSAYVQDINSFVVTLTTDDDTLVTAYFYCLIFYDETALFDSRLYYLESDIVTGMSWVDFDLTTKNFVWKSPGSFFYGIAGLSYGTNTSIDVTFSEASLTTTGTMLFYTLQISYFNVRVRQCPVPYYYFSNVSMQCWDTCSDPTMYYNSSTPECLPCFYPCYSCDPANISLCLSCDPSTNRLLNGMECQCMPGYYEIGLKVCQKCPSWCLNCTTPSICTACDPSAFRYLEDDTCYCMDGYVDFFPTNTTCKPCGEWIPGCVVCWEAMRCETCDESRFFKLYDLWANTVSVFAVVAPQTPSAYCICFSGYYLSNGVCVPCARAIAGCLDCSEDGTICYNCLYEGRFWLNGTVCSCNTNFYLSGDICAPCPYWCYDCVSPTICTYFNNEFGYIDNGTGGYACDPVGGFYQKGIYCYRCWDAIPGCISCTSETVCTQCANWILNFGISPTFNCECSVGVYDPMTSTCVACTNCCAQNGFFNTNSNICETCSTYLPGCMSCENSTSCRKCAIGYYLNYDYTLGMYTTCSLCSDTMPGCLVCSGSSSCDACDASADYYLNTMTWTCSCAPYYYPDSAGICNLLCSNSYPGCLQCYSDGGCNICNTSAGYLMGEGCYCQYGYWNGTQCGFCSDVVANCSNSCYLDTSVTPSNFICNGCQSPFVLNNNQCQCPAPYNYRVGVYCVPCWEIIIGCDQCLNETFCTSCYDGDGFELNPVNSSTQLCSCAAGTSLFAGYYCEDPLSYTYCDPGYFFDGYSCESCWSQCAECYGFGGNCTVCSNSSVSVYLGSCDCPPGMYMDQSMNCYYCDWLCFKCFGYSEYCTDCYFPAVLYGNECVCPAGYFYDDNNEECSPCSLVCFNCTGPSMYECVGGCNMTNSVPDPTGTTCLCLTGFYPDITATPFCGPCHYSCLNCTGPTDTECTYCDSTNFRDYIIGSNTCPCNTGWYDAGIALCSICDYTCFECTGPLNTNCLSCDLSMFRTFINSNSSCPCSSGYYDPNNVQCLPCHYTCLTCNGPTSTNCLTCDPTSPRFFQGTNNSCPCATSWYDNGVNTWCDPCASNCLTCYGSSDTNCLACDPVMFRAFYNVNNSCPCIGGYYDPDDILCAICHYSCLTCNEATLTDCLTCDPSMSRTFDPSNNSCPCDVTWYDVGIALCAICDYTCLTCSGPLPTDCLTCNSANQRTISGTTCPCDTNFFDNNVPVCNACDYSCLTCLGPLPTDCVTCDPANIRTLTGGNSCPCNSLYYDPGVPLCAACGYSCLSCVNNTLNGCITCDPTTLRTFTAATNSCDCPSAYFDRGVAVCVACQYSCLTCNGPTANTCLSCDSTGLRTLTGTSCPCNPAYFDNGVFLCAACSYTCLTCNGPAATNCLSCNSTNMRSLAGGNSCPCQAAFYDSGTALCSACDYTCFTCSGPSPTNCLTCDPGNFRSFVAGGTCPCNSLFVDAGVALCVCQAGYSLDFSTGTCRDICGDGLLYDLPCDDGNLVDGDGCSSSCQIETNFTCVNGSTTTPSVCGYNQPLAITLLDTQKNPAANQVVFTLDISPALSFVNSLNFSKILTTNLNGMGTVVFSYDSNGTLTVTVDYNQPLQNTTVQLMLSPAVSGSGLTFAMPDTSLEFMVSPTNNIPANYLDSSTYQTVDKMDICFKALTYAALASFVLALFTSKFIGIEMIGVVQVAYISLLMINLLHPFLSPIKFINLVNGPNTAFQKDRLALTNPLPNRITALEFLPPLAYSVNYSLILLLFPPLFSLIFYLVAKYYKNPDKEQKEKKSAMFRKWSELALGEWGLTVIMFVLYNCMTGFAIAMFYYRTSELLAFSLVEAVIIVAYLVAILVLFKIRPKFFGDYKLGFKNDNLSQLHYWLLSLDRILLAVLLVSANNSDYVGFICLPVPLAAGIYLAVRRPYDHLYNTVRQILNQVVVFVLLVIYGYYRTVVTYLQHFTNGNDILPFVVLALLFCCVIYNTVFMVKYWWDRRKEQIERTKDEKMLKEVNDLLTLESNKPERGMRRGRNVPESPKMSLLKMVGERARTSDRKKQSDKPEILSPLKSNRQQLKDKLLVKDKLLSKKKKKSTLKEMVNEILINADGDAI